MKVKVINKSCAFYDKVVEVEPSGNHYYVHYYVSALGETKTLLLNKYECVNWENINSLDESIKETTKFDEGKPCVREFETGAKRDSDKDKEDYIESVSWLTLMRYAKYMKVQEVRYGRGNWKKGIPIEEYEKSLLRHIQKYIANKYDHANLEPEVDHLSAAFFNLQGLIHELEKINLK